jgi:glycosyltransferase involved in cell wall biosynthesis
MASKSNRVVKQVIVGAASYDAITSIAIELGQELGKDFDTKIYSWFEPDISVADVVSQIGYADEGSPDDILIYHLSFGIPELTEWLLRRPEKVILWYHNVTPAEFFTEIDPVFADGLAHGRKQIEIFQKRVIAAFADSSFNAGELTSIGYEDVVVSCPTNTANRLNDVGIDVRMLDQIQERFPNGFVLSVSQVLPHKKVEEVISVLHLLREYHGVDIGLVWAGPIRSPMYMQAIELFMERLGQENIYFTDVVDETELATLYRTCTAFVSMSKHEGLSVPPLEAMANRTPVIVRGACAVPETVGSGGLVLPEDWGVIEFAEVLAQVCRDSQLQSVLRNAGQEWIESYQSRGDISEVINIIKAIAA